MISPFSIIIGLILAGIVFFLAEWILEEAGAPKARVIAALLALLAFVGCAFGL